MSRLSTGSCVRSDPRAILPVRLEVRYRKRLHTPASRAAFDTWSSARGKAKGLASDASLHVRVRPFRPLPRPRATAMDFDLSSFAEALATAAPATPLCWRDDPESSLSDWILRVEAPGANATYHVHRAMLATGVRRSEYFARLFTGAGTSGLVENVQGSSTIPLEPSAANAFPAFLDFVYKGELTISDASAMALRHLAEYFFNRPLYDQVTTYLQSALKAQGRARLRGGQTCRQFGAPLSCGGQPLRVGQGCRRVRKGLRNAPSHSRPRVLRSSRASALFARGRGSRVHEPRAIHRALRSRCGIRQRAFSALGAPRPVASHRRDDA